MKKVRQLIGAIVMALLLVDASSTLAQTIIINPTSRPILPPQPIPRPMPPQRDTPLEVRVHSVDTTITDGVAQTKIDQVFFNPLDRVVEGTYIFPLDDDVALGQFSMEVNGQTIDGELLNVEQARSTYESIVARMRDPALLEYLGTKMFRARIFPINPKTEVRIHLTYTQMLETNDGLVRYRYPLGTDRSLTRPIDSMAVTVHIESQTPIRSVFSPTHKVAVNKKDEHKASASFEASHVRPAGNFELYYTLSKKEFGLTVLTYRPHGQDGFFLVRIAPPVKNDPKEVLPKDITFVIDISGSMSGEKIAQAKRSLTFCLDHLNRNDRFNIIPFSHEPTKFRDQLVAATSDEIKAAHEFVNNLNATGGTNINDALLAAIDPFEPKDQNRPHQIVFMTDGMPTVGTIATEDILKNVAKRNDGRVRLYVFGVGYDVNTQLLDLLAEKNNGTRDYVEPNEDLEIKLSSFYRKVSEPVLAGVELIFNNLDVYDMFPPKPGDLFAGGEVVVSGRYKGQGNKAVELKGTRRGRTQRFTDEVQFPSEESDHAFLAKLWAVRKVGYLLDEIRLHGTNKELKDTIVKLATKYGIVTPYTAYLVTEPGSVAMNAGGRIQLFQRAVDDVLERNDGSRRELYDVALAMGGPADGSNLGVTRLVGAGGGGAPSVEPEARVARVQASRHMAKSREADVFDAVHSVAFQPQPMTLGDTGGADAKKGDRYAQPTVQRVAGRTFYRVGEKWIDDGYDGKSETIKIELFSKAYFELLRKKPELAKCLALGDLVIVFVDKTVYETVQSSPNP